MKILFYLLLCGAILFSLDSCKKITSMPVDEEPVGNDTTPPPPPPPPPVMQYVVTTFAGAGKAGKVDGVDSTAQFDFPQDLVADDEGNIFVVDMANNVIRKIKDGKVSTFAGSGKASFQNGQGINSAFDQPIGITIDKEGNLYVTDAGNYRIRKITPDAKVSTFSGLGKPGHQDSISALSMYKSLRGIAIDSSGSLLVTDENWIRKVSPDGSASTLTGAEKGGYADGEIKEAKFNSPTGITVDADGNIFVSDAGNYRVRKINVDGLVSTLAGAGTPGSTDGKGFFAKFGYLWGIKVAPSGNIYLADAGQNEGIKNTIRMITSIAEVTTIAGGEQGYKDGVGKDASFRSPHGLWMNTTENIFYVADYIDARIRKISYEEKPQ